MRNGDGIHFGVQLGPITRPGASEKQIYDEVLADCEVAASLGYESVWLVEHHFTDYYPNPSPLLLLAHIAARFPDLDLGTCVLVTPWYQPLRMAEEIAMLSLLSNGHLHIGLGRGTAKHEYDAHDVPMEESRDRFREGLEVLRKALSGEPFTYSGRYASVPREVRIRPTPRAEQITLYGAIGSPQSAGVLGELRLPPLSVSNFPFELQAKILETWADSAAKHGGPIPGRRPIVLGALMAETDEAARAMARREIPPFFELQARHYEADADPWRELESYQQFSRFFANLKRLANPDNLDPYLDLQLYGSTESAKKRLGRYLDLGFDTIVLSSGSPAQSPESRHRILEQFAREVIPSLRERKAS